MSRLRVSVRSDGLAAEVQAAPGPAANELDVRAALAAAKVVHGLDDAAIAALAQRLADPAAKAAAVVARGTGPVAGVDGALVFAPPLQKLPGTTHADGSIDWHERELLRPAASGDEVARIQAPTSGTPGTDVRGAALPARPGRPFTQRLGPGVRADGGAVLASRGGVVLATERQVDVVPLWSHPADVDLASGSLHTAGSLQVRGDVREGFAATAGGDVQIAGSVLDGSVTAGGSVRIDQGILGQHAEIEAGEDLVARHATSARLRAGKLVELGDEATHCRVLADSIRIVRGRGVAFGGELRARQTIELKVAGTANGARTCLSVCDLLDERTELARRESDAARVGRSPPRLAGGKGTRLATRAVDHREQERLRMLARQREMLRTAVIRITDTVHPGVVLQFGQVSLPIDERLAASSFRFDSEQNTIVRGPLP